ncbi:FAD-dependent monooxygenase [Rhodobacteraceae bacterium NNCM2]|nr:FAD-dependent monooxygenase [Coraliihabitans acroporae]
MRTTDIVVAGGGIAGMAAAARLGAMGRSVVLIDPAPPGSSTDLRTTAFLGPAIDTLTRAGVWTGAEGQAAPLSVMRLVDAGGVERCPRETADFRADEMRDGPFGWNIANTAIRAALEARLAELGVTRLTTSAVGSTARDRQRIVRLADGGQIAAELVIAADGRDSVLREEAGLARRRWSYGQKALVFAVHHDRPHQGVSTEIHRTGGPLTLVPMPDRDGRPTSSVVWMTPGPRALALQAMADGDLGAELTRETMGLFGPLEITGPRALWPIISQLADRLTAPRLVLIAEAAHVIPPIGAQGLNMSLADVECLAGLIEKAADPGASGVTAAYGRRRWPEMAARVAGIDALNRAAQAELQPLRDLRRIGLKAINEIAPLRRVAMRLGMGS